MCNVCVVCGMCVCFVWGLVCVYYVCVCARYLCVCVWYVYVVCVCVVFVCDCVVVMMRCVGCAVPGQPVCCCAENLYTNTARIYKYCFR